MIVKNDLTQRNLLSCYRAVACYEFSHLDCPDEGFARRQQFMLGERFVAVQPGVRASTIVVALTGILNDFNRKPKGLVALICMTVSVLRAILLYYDDIFSLMDPGPGIRGLMNIVAAPSRAAFKARQVEIIVSFPPQIEGC